MAAIVQSAKSANNASSVAFASAVTAGNLLIAAIGVANGTLTNPESVSDTRGNTWTQAGYSLAPGGGANGVAIFWAVANATNTTTVTVASPFSSGGASQIIVAELSGTYTAVIDSIVEALGTAQTSQSDIIFTAQYYSGTGATSVSGTEAVVEATTFSDRRTVLSWDQLATAGFYSSSQTAGSAGAAITVAFRVANTAPAAPYVRQRKASTQSGGAVTFPGPVLATTSLLITAFGQTNGDLANPMTFSDTFGSTWTQGVYQNTAGSGNNGCSIFYALSAGTGKETITPTWVNLYADEVILVEVVGFDFQAVDVSGHGTAAPTVTLTSATDIVFTLAYYNSNPTPTVSGGDALVQYMLFGDRSMALAWNVHPSSGSYTSTLAVGSSPAYVTLALSAVPLAVDLSPSGIASAEAFGTATIVTSEIILSPTGIPSAEAFGTPELIADSQYNLHPTGIASAEAFGTPAVVVGPATVSPSSIASSEGFGHPRIAQAKKARLLIGSINRTAYLHHESSFSWNLMKGARGSCSIPLVVEPGDEFAPSVGEFIEIFDPTDSRVWAGTIEQVFSRWFGDDGWLLFVVTGVTLDSLFDAAFVDKTVFTGVSGGSAFSDLFTASGVTQVTLGTVDAGETITALEVTRISDGFASIALRSNLVWFIDPSNLTINLVSSVARAAPWVMVSEDMVWESMQWRQSRADFRDTQVIQSPDGSSQTILAVTANDSIGRRAARLTITTSNTDAGAIQEATAVLHRFSTLPSQLVVSTDRPGVSIGMLLEIDVDRPLEASGLLNGFWQVNEVEAVMLTGMDTVDASIRRLPDDLSLGHFRYTLHLVNSLAMAIFQGDGSTTVFALPLLPSSVVSVRVSPNGHLYASIVAGASITITPAMPPGTNGRVDYNGQASPDADSFLDMWRKMSPLAASAGPASGGGGSGPQRFIADAPLRNLTILDDAAPHAIVTHAGTGLRVLAVLRLLLGADLVVRIKLNGTALLTVVIDSGTAVDTVLEYPLSARQCTVTIANPGVVSVLDASLGNGNTVVLHTTGALPTGLLADTTYYVVNTAGGSFELSATLGGSSIVTSGTQSGKHWLTSPDIAAPDFVDKDILTLDILDSDGAIDADGIASITVEWEG